MANRPTMAFIKFDRFKFKSSRVTEFNMTRAVRRMDENIVEVAMLLMTSEFIPEDARVIADRHRDETVPHRQYKPWINEVRGASSEREKTQEGMTSSATCNDGDKTKIQQQWQGHHQVPRLQCSVE